MKITYPDFWPQPDNRHPEYLRTRITEAQKIALYTREVTTRDLAQTLGVTEKHLSTFFPGKCPIPDKRLLIKARREYKLEVAKEVLRGKYTVNQAAKLAYTSYSTMLRRVKEAYNADPEAYKGVKNHGIRCF